ncbi:amino acid ABC transporter permease [Propionicicella superfundia]|uniref:amino acid ABC transporter permease n=1 Tax=Propionicicella superfundia TaxID=348582 RepID=UPI00040F6731|nr:amino acid ABC transporter permease [Propionicicella superfundia]
MIEILRDNAGFLAQGALVTVLLTVIGFLGASVLGTVTAIFRVSPIAPLRWVGTIYVEFFRNIPLLSLLVLITFGLPEIGLLLPLFWCGAVGLILSGSAFVCETVRSGINTVSLGQSEAARALGMSFTQQLRLIILPQAFRKMIQPMVNVFIGVLIGSSLVAAVGVSDITNVTQQLNIRYAEAVFLFLLSGGVYLLLAMGAGGVGGALERRLSRSRISSRGAK